MSQIRIISYHNCLHIKITLTQLSLSVNDLERVCCTDLLTAKRINIKHKLNLIIRFFNDHHEYFIRIVFQKQTYLMIKIDQRVYSTRHPINTIISWNKLLRYVLKILVKEFY